MRVHLPFSARPLLSALARIRADRAAARGQTGAEVAQQAPAAEVVGETILIVHDGQMRLTTPTVTRKNNG